VQTEREDFCRHNSAKRNAMRGFRMHGSIEKTTHIDLMGRLKAVAVRKADARRYIGAVSGPE
jgi:hypothetical protein